MSVACLSDPDGDLTVYGHSSQSSRVAQEAPTFAELLNRCPTPSDAWCRCTRLGTAPPSEAAKMCDLLTNLTREAHITGPCKGSVWQDGALAYYVRDRPTPVASFYDVAAARRFGALRPSSPGVHVETCRTPLPNPL
jgi:hypothetical protein